MAAARQCDGRHIVLSLDAPEPEAHDRFRRAPGAFRRTLVALRAMEALGLAGWVNTALLPTNAGRLGELACLLTALQVKAWNLLAVIPTGRGRRVESLTAQQYEETFSRIYALSASLPFPVHVSYAPQYRRVIYQALLKAGELETPRGRALLAPGPAPADGSLFIGHRGDVWPSGVLPLSAGNVRQQPLAQLYNDSPLFRELRDLSLIKGKCQGCEFLPLCRGGSRARAYADTGDYLAPEPICLFEPPAGTS